jgi:hypothetical protein
MRSLGNLIQQMKLGSVLAVLTVLALASCAQPEEQAVVPFHATGTVDNLMVWGIEPSADLLWDSAGYIVTEDGEEDLQPTTDEGWDQVRNAATVVAEAGNLLMMPGYAADDGDWLEYAAGLTTAGMSARKAAQAHDADALFEAGGALYNVCKACHNRYIIQAAEGE